MIKPKQYREVMKFIKNFKRFDKTKEITKTFSNGYCYYFAQILHLRFPDSTIVFYEVRKHFACKIQDSIFDITGDITSFNLFFEDWEEFKIQYPEEAEAIKKSCIDKV